MLYERAQAHLIPNHLMKGMNVGKVSVIWSAVLDVSCSRLIAPISACSVQNSLPRAGGVGVPNGLRLKLLPMQLLGVRGIFLASMRIRSHGFSLRSRISFLK